MVLLKKAFALVIFFLFSLNLLAENQTVVIDAKHYSNVMGEIRNYRVFLPKDYYDEPHKKYSVVYLYHGWSQRYFGSLRGNEVNDGKPTDEERIAQLVSTYGFIVVKPDGYNSWPEEPYNLRPYNIGPVINHRQFPLYFPELVDHIDANYQTLAKRENRGIMGHSMGGFMSFWIAGKFPDLVTAAGSFCGSPEFVIGPKDFPVEYFHRDMFQNYNGLKLRLHYGENDFIRAYHRDIDRHWKHLMGNYESRTYPGAHDLSGLEDMFRFFSDAFKEPSAKPEKWHHIDVYPDFSVWDYRISSDREIPGFTVLEDVDTNGFRVSVRTVLPQGESLPMVNVSLTTAPLYKKNQEYEIHIYEYLTGKTSRNAVKSDGEGKLSMRLNGGLQQVGIHEPGGKPNIAISKIIKDSASWLKAGGENSVTIQLLNIGGSQAEGLTATLSSRNSSTVMSQDYSEFGNLNVWDLKTGKSPFIFKVVSDTVQVQNLDLTVRDKSGNQWQHSFVLNLRPEGKNIVDFEVADGRRMTFAKSGKDTVSMVLGKGNGDGIANPGESVVILVKDEGLLRLANLHTLNNFIENNHSHNRISDSWSSFDHVGGTFKFSMPVIASDCPSGTKIPFYAEYWIPDYPDHHIKGGQVILEISGKDQTPPQLDWVKLRGDNIFQAKIFDGAEISEARIVLFPEEEPEKEYYFELKDDGSAGDRVAGDMVFSKKISLPKFGPYKGEITVRDIYGNEERVDLGGGFIFHGAKLFHK